MKRATNAKSPAPPGFTLVEIAVVMVVLGLLMGGMLLPLSAARDISEGRAAEAALREIRDALLGYAAIHGVLPCPDTGQDAAAPEYGRADVSCAQPQAEGFLPFKTLGLTESDPWGMRWRYRVDANFANAAAPITLATPLGGASGGEAGVLRVRNHEGAYLTTADERPVAIFYSIGPNARPDGRNDSFEAIGGDYESGTPTPEFDDRLHWLARPLLFNRLIAAGRAL
ncbi:MAG: prepilin-type N-terminal cleavage/methylation domain-containing protein [Zoogloeaceae bacterium]|jgi:prepilin-type N-terminal cleavage/methylation domain-containing protein|nr:prepilin-type N-terminal cleavage/methylation domain-containing protein [Zoogloeaceae bacterium]